jgi:hypothetical protein
MAKKAARKSKPSKVKSTEPPQRRLRYPAPPGLAEKLRSKVPCELVEKLREFEAQAEAYQTTPPNLAEARAEIDRVQAIRDGLIPPTRPRRMESRKESRKKPQVSFAKELIAAVYPGGEWRIKTSGVVRHACASEAEARGRPLPSRDSFARAMDRWRR